MFGLIADNELYLKVDDQNRSRFEALGLEAFTYYKQDKPMQLGYFQAPEEAMENSEVMTEWGAQAFECALRAATQNEEPDQKKQGKQEGKQEESASKLG